MWANHTNIEGTKHSFIQATKWLLDDTNYTISLVCYLTDMFTKFKVGSKQYPPVLFFITPLQWEWNDAIEISQMSLHGTYLS